MPNWTGLRAQFPSLKNWTYLNTATYGQTPKFARQYANLGEMIRQAATEYCADVQSGAFPSDAESYHGQAAVVRRRKPISIVEC